MRQSAIFTMLSVPFLSVLAASMPFDNHPLDKRITHSGRGTWFNDGLGACGQYNSDSDSIVALSVGYFGSGEHCNQWVMITNDANGDTVYAQALDKCPGCGLFDLDLSIGAFHQIGDLSTGVLAISWNFMPQGWSPY